MDYLIRLAVNSDTNMQGLLEGLVKAGVSTAVEDEELVWTVKIAELDYQRFETEIEILKSIWSAHEV